MPRGGGRGQSCAPLLGLLRTCPKVALPSLPSSDCCPSVASPRSRAGQCGRMSTELVSGKWGTSCRPGSRPTAQPPRPPQPASLSTFAHTPFCSRPTRVSGLWLLAILKHPSARAGKCLHLTQSCHVPSVTGRAESFSLPASLTHKTPRRPSVAWTQRDCGRSRVLLQALKGSAT